MKTIEVKTTQNVTLEYELADLRDRAAAFLLDQMILALSILLLSAVFFGWLDLKGTVATVFSFIVFGIYLFYSLAMETLNNGQTVGKMAMRIQVIKTVGGQAQFADYAARWVFRLVDIFFTLGTIASILVTSSASGQRIGDIVANTAVIKKNAKYNLVLSDLLTIRSQESYKPVYAQARQLEESHVLLIKRTLERHREFQNVAHRQAVELLARQVKSMISVTAHGENDVEFLKTILNDYVVLTR